MRVKWLVQDFCGNALRVDGVSVLLIADRTLMSNHRQNEFLGFGATAPPNVVPERLYKQLPNRAVVLRPHGQVEGRRLVWSGGNKPPTQRVAHQMPEARSTLVQKDSQNSYFKGGVYSPFLRLLYHIFVWRVERKAKGLGVFALA